jgi:L-rhamnose mutarotase
MKRYCLTLDLKNDPKLIAEYKRHHERIWPEVRDSLHEAGVLEMEIYLFDTRMFMIMDTRDDYTFENHAAIDNANPKLGEWQDLMGTFQQLLSGTKPGEKWRLMEKVFQLSKQ